MQRNNLGFAPYNGDENKENDAMEFASPVQVIEAMQSINAVDVREGYFPPRFTGGRGPRAAARDSG